MSESTYISESVINLSMADGIHTVKKQKTKSFYPLFSPWPLQQER